LPPRAPGLTPATAFPRLLDSLLGCPKPLFPPRKSTGSGSSGLHHARPCDIVADRRGSPVTSSLPADWASRRGRQQVYLFSPPAPWEWQQAARVAVVLRMGPHGHEPSIWAMGLCGWRPRATGARVPWPWAQKRVRRLPAEAVLRDQVADACPPPANAVRQGTGAHTREKRNAIRQLLGATAHREAADPLGTPE